MTFVALVLALFVEQALSPVVQARGEHLAKRWIAWVTQRMQGRGVLLAWLTWAVMVLVPAFAAAWVHGVLAHVWSVLAWLWLVTVLVFAVGFSRYAKRLAALSEAVELGDESEVKRMLSEAAVNTPTQGVDAGLDWRARALGHAALAAHRQALAIVVATLLGWMFGSAVFGVVLYAMAKLAWQAVLQPELALSDVAATDGGNATGSQVTPIEVELLQVTQSAWSWIDGLAARASVLAVAITGSFERVAMAWREFGEGWGSASDRLLLGAVGAGLGLNEGALVDAVDVGEAGGVVGFQHFSALDSMVWRALSFWLVVFAVLALLS